MSRPARVRTGVLATAFLLLFATAAFSATSTVYTGKTSQQRNIRVIVTAGSSASACSGAAQCVTGMRFKINERCPDGHTLVDDERGFHMAIQGGRFSGTFVPAVNPHTGEKTVINGKVSGGKVTGSISSTSFSNRTARLCHGNATFTARR